MPGGGRAVPQPMKLPGSDRGHKHFSSVVNPRWFGRCLTRSRDASEHTVRYFARNNVDTCRIEQMKKVAFIGAGSVEFTRNVVNDLLTSPELDPLAISLHD